METTAPIRDRGDRASPRINVVVEPSAVRDESTDPLASEASLPLQAGKARVGSSERYAQEIARRARSLIREACHERCAGTKCPFTPRPSRADPTGESFTPRLFMPHAAAGPTRLPVSAGPRTAETRRAIEQLRASLGRFDRWSETVARRFRFVD